MRRIPKYRLHRASGRAVVTLNGKDHYLGRYNSSESRAEYDRLIGEWMIAGRHAPVTSGHSDVTVSDLVAAYLSFAETYYSRDGEPTSEYTAMVHASRPLATLYGRHPVSEFGPVSLKAVRESMVKQGLARRHINQRVNRIRRMIKWGVENELVPSSALHGLQAVAPLKRGRTEAPETEPVQPVPDANVEAVLPFVARQVAAMIQLQRLTGMRPGEVVLLRPCDLDRSSDVWLYVPSAHKTAHHGHRREIYFGPKAQAVLAPFLDRDPHAYCFSPLEAEAERNAQRRQNRQTPMTPSQAKRRAKSNPKRPKRERYDRDSYRRAIEYGIKRAKCPHWHPHQLRHSCGTHIRRDFGLDAAQVILGHRSAVITEVYAEVNRKRALEVIAQVG